MGNSLFDQLKKSGLVDEKKAKRIKAEKHKQRKQQSKNKSAQLNDAQRSAETARNEIAERDRALNRQRQEEAERKAIAAQIKQLIDTHRVTDRDGEIAYNFTHDVKIKRLHVTENIHKQLSAGNLVIVSFNDQYEIVPKAVAEKIRQRNERCVLTSGSSSAHDTDKPDDPYAAYKVPDDLMW